MTRAIVATIGGVFLAVLLVPLLLAGGATGSSAKASSGAGSNADGPPMDPDRYVFPLVGGNPRYGPYHHDYPATDIFVPIGTRVVACVNAVVIHVSREDIGKGGLSVTLRGEDGWRYYYAHLSSVAPDVVPGLALHKGHPLGRSGNSGNARYTAPHLHFGISLNGYIAGEISPYPYLRAWPRLMP